MTACTGCCLHPTTSWPKVPSRDRNRSLVRLVRSLNVPICFYWGEEKRGGLWRDSRNISRLPGRTQIHPGIDLIAETRYANKRRMSKPQLCIGLHREESPEKGTPTAKGLPTWPLRIWQSRDSAEDVSKRRAVAVGRLAYTAYGAAFPTASPPPCHLGFLEKESAVAIGGLGIPRERAGSRLAIPS